MKTVKIYKVTCTTAPSMDAEGSGFSLSPWGSNTDHYEGYDDGGIDYHLPPSCTLATTRSGELTIFDAKGNSCFLISEDPRKQRPALLVGNFTVSLQRATRTERLVDICEKFDVVRNKLWDEIAEDYDNRAKDVRLKKSYDAICSAQLILNDAIREMH